MKTLGYKLFSLMYNIFRLFPLKDKLALCICTHDDGIGSNAVLAAKALEELDEGYKVAYITKTDMELVKGGKSLLRRLSFFLAGPYAVARAKIVLMDNIFLPFAYLKIRRGVKVIQLWHGTGTIKKFGQDANTGRLKELEYRANRNITHLIVNSERLRGLYAGAFGIDEGRVYPIGLPRSDEMIKRIKGISEKGCNEDKERLYERHAIGRDKKLVLYAPTFRDDGQDIGRIPKISGSIISKLPDEYVLGLRLHPFVADNIKGYTLPDRVVQLSFESDLSEVLIASDILITDYSSIIFEYCLLGRPMIFLAYDLEEFSSRGRGFYTDYESSVPGPVVRDVSLVAGIITGGRYDTDKADKFREENFPHRDGRATKRLLDLIRQP